MQNRIRTAPGVVAVLCLSVASGSAALAQGRPPDPGAGRKEAAVTRASGTFEVKLSPQATDDRFVR